MISEYYGFVYLITCAATCQKYIGKKLFWSKRTLPPLKGKKRKRHIKKESDWQSYWSSSKVVHELMELHGEQNFSREIISLHHNKQETNYHEMKLQMMLDVLDTRMENGEYQYLNENINTRFFRSKKEPIIETRLNTTKLYKGY